MYFLDKAEAATRLADLGFDFDNLKAAMAEPIARSPAVVKNTRKEFQNSFLAAKHVVEFFGEYTQCLLYVHSMGGRPSLENRHMYDRLRLSYEEYRTNSAAPGLLFEAHHAFDLLTFCDVVINSAFRAVLVQHITRNWVAFTDDDAVRLFAGRTAN